MLIEILGPGCQRCSEAERRARQAVKLDGIAATVRHIPDPRTMAERRVMLTPAEGGGSVNYAADSEVGE